MNAWAGRAVLVCLGAPHGRRCGPLLCAWPWLPTRRSLAHSGWPVAHGHVLGALGGEGRGGFLILQNPHSELWSPWPCLAWWSPQTGLRGVNPPALQDEQTAATGALSNSPGGMSSARSASGRDSGTRSAKWRLLAVTEGRAQSPWAGFWASLGPRRQGSSWSLISAWEGKEALVQSSLMSSCKDPVASGVRGQGLLLTRW